MGEVNCFMLGETGRARRSLRRYCPSTEEKPCPSPRGLRYHNALLALDEVPAADYYDTAQKWPMDDPRWPRACVCGYSFTEDDEWQVFYETLYKRSDNDHVTTLGDAPVGAMWFADWMSKPFHGTDGHCLVVKLPDGYEWMVDGPAKDGGRWIRTGVPPLVSASPSIVTPNWHGFLTNGILRGV